MVTLVEVTDANWREVADVAPRDDQREWVASSAAHYLLLSLREGIWHSLGIEAQGRVVGHLMWAFDGTDGSHWIGGVIIAADEQGKGYGRAAMEEIIRCLHVEQGAKIIKLSYSPTNRVAARLYESMAFRPTGEMEGDEVVVARPARE